MADYSNARALAESLLRERGSSLTVHRLDRVPYDPILLSSLPVATLQSESAVGVVLPSVVKALREFDDFIRDNPQHVTQFRAVYVAGKGLLFPPDVEDLIETPEGFFRVVGKVTLDPDGQGPILYTLGCVSSVPYSALVILFIPDTILLENGANYLTTESGQPLLYDARPT